MNEAVQLAQNIIRHMTRCTGLAVQENRNVFIALTHFSNKRAQVIQGGQIIVFGIADELLIVNR